MDELDTSSVSLPLVADKSEYLQQLNEFTTDNIPPSSPVIEVFNKEKYTQSVNKFQEINKLKDSLSTKTQQFEEVLKSLMMTKPSSRVHYNLLTGMWTAEDGSTTHMPFGVHQIYEEIVAPIVQNLMQENRIERLKIYNHIKDQKMSYLNKWHQDVEAFYRASRAESSDIINLMQESLREYVAAYNALTSLQRTEDSMVQSNDNNLDTTIVNVTDNSAETISAFTLQSQEFAKVQTDFEDYMDRLKEDIDQKAEKFGHVEYYDAKLRDGHSNEIAVATDEVRFLDERRKPLALVNPLFAKTSELPPAPNVEEITFEHISLNLPVIAKNALEDLKEAQETEETITNA